MFQHVLSKKGRRVASLHHQRNDGSILLGPSATDAFVEVTGTGAVSFPLRIHGTSGIFTYIYHKFKPNAGKYTSRMDTMGLIKLEWLVEPPKSEKIFVEIFFPKDWGKTDKTCLKPPPKTDLISLPSTFQCSESHGVSNNMFASCGSYQRCYASIVYIKNNLPSIIYCAIQQTNKHKKHVT